ncbi:hypothetical protein MUCCIDRAFT_107835 [Mucor lusitanicus CBS 277.49]|uniref:Uncharacterized protein n=2 Tax=Mucor circinelloides f. lusitanicus TaxID=29924 RepID=A0A168P6A2_MUCCL|nr:hypothetical protein MUCCIDRAFT_107835 [Mucor lusitanicus CBS 277.49]
MGVHPTSAFRRKLELYDEALKELKHLRINLRSLLKGKKGDDDEGNDKDRRIRTTSPVRDDLEKLMEKAEDMKEMFGGIAADPSSVVPTALKAICQGCEFVEINWACKNIEEAAAREEADEFVAVVGGRLVESLAVSHKGSWIFITEVEAYMRGAKDVDDCANTTITVNYPETPRFVVEQKREYQNQWYEAKVYFKHFEFLVTGCLCGTYDDDDLQAFLGASLGNHVP